MRRLAWLVPMSVLCCPVLLAGQDSFVGILGGISTLSADGRSVVTSSSRDVSLYKPENGATFQVFAGRHLTDYLSVQVGYGWNRNSLALTSLQSPAANFYEQSRRATQHTVVGELLLYFRNLDSGVRPYLSIGTGVVRLSSPADSIERTIGTAPAPGEIVSGAAALRVAVGIDMRLGGGWAFRFTFSETIRGNAISDRLSPPGRRNLANFQNLFGLVKRF